MKRDTPLKRAAWPRRAYVPPPVPPLTRGRGGRYTAVAEAVHAVAKPVARRNAHLLAMAAGRPCLLRAPGVICASPETTVACHSNRPEHGKAHARKADDQYSVWGCFACHSWLDQGRADGDLKALIFMRAHADQVLAWRAIVMDSAQPAKDRQAAAWALNHLNASPGAPGSPL